MKKLAIFCAAIMVSNLAFAADYVLRINNKTGVDLHQVYVSHEKTDDWEDDILDSDEILSSGDNVKLTLEDYNSPWFDVMGVDEKGNQYTRYEVNVEKDDVTLTSRDLEQD